MKWGSGVEAPVAEGPPDWPEQERRGAVPGVLPPVNILDDLHHRLDEYEEVLEADAEGLRRRRVPQVVIGEARVDDGFKDTVMKLKLSALSPLGLWNKIVEAFVIISLVNWPFRHGFQKRLGPRFLSTIYAQNIWAKDFAVAFLTPRGLLKCPLAKDMIPALEGCDTLVKNSPEARSLMGDAGQGPSQGLLVRAGVASTDVAGLMGQNPINHPILESLARTGYSRFRGFEHVLEEGDWKKPRSNNNNWSSKVDFDLMVRLDPKLEPDTNASVFEEVEDEVRDSRNRDIQLAQVQDRLAARVRGLDLINNG
jgi:hypothetical protein